MNDHERLKTSLEEIISRETELDVESEQMSEKFSCWQNVIKRALRATERSFIQKSVDAANIFVLILRLKIATATPAFNPSHLDLSAAVNIKAGPSPSKKKK
jgi:hypothetical protein